MLTRATGAPLLTPEQVDALLVQPALGLSVAAQVARVVPMTGSSLRLPLLTDPGPTGWVAEGAEIPVGDAVFAEVDVIPGKIAGLRVISRELADDSSPAAAETIGAAMAAKVADDLDSAYFGNLAAPAPKGLAGLVGVTQVPAGASFTDLDPFATAVSRVARVGGTVGAWVAHPDDELTLALIKGATGSKVPLLAADATEGARRIIEGRVLLVSAAVTPGIVWGIPLGRTVIGLRDDATVDVDRSRYFESDRVGVRCTLRAGLGFQHPAAVARVALSSAPAAPTA